MVRSYWITILALGLAWAGGASAQEQRLQPVPAAGSGERTMTVQEMGKAPRKCRVVQDWRQTSGAMAYKVQAIDTGEYLTIAENPAVAPTESVSVPVVGSSTPMVLKTMATRIYHWGNSTTSPAGAPVPPQTAEPTMTASSTTAPSSCNCGSGQNCGCQDPAPTGGIRPLFPRLRQALAGDSSYPVTTGEQVTSIPEQTIVEADQGPPAPGLGSRFRDGLQSLFKNRTTSDPVMTTQAASASAPAPTPAAPTPATPYAPPAAEKTVVAPDDWRKSWGQPSEHKTQPTAKLSEDTSAAKKKDTTGFAQPPNSMTEAKNHPDPLVNPDKLVVRGEEKLNAAHANEFHISDELPPPAPPYQTGANPTLAAQPFTGKMPLGAQSVLAAGSGPNTQVQYLPVPVVTVPTAPPPLPPTTGVPVAPPPPVYVNAFTPPASPMANPGPAFMPPRPAMAYGPAPYPPPGYVSNAYMPGQGYGQNPYFAGGQGTGSPYPSAYPPAAQPQQRPPVSYQGPTPPNPLGSTTVAPVSYVTSTAPMVTVNPAMDRRVVTAPAAPVTSQETLKQLITTLRESIYPSQREMAAEGLMAYDWHEYPQALEVLMLTARDDAAPLVRATCVHCLARFNVRSERVRMTLESLRNDADPRVRQEVEEALVKVARAGR
jgi:hypothetical protein